MCTYEQLITTGHQSGLIKLLVDFVLLILHNYTHCRTDTQTAGIEQALLAKETLHIFSIIFYFNLFNC
jgi:hypothetical protein